MKILFLLAVIAVLDISKDSPAPALVAIGGLDISNGESEETTEGARNRISDHEHIETPLELVAWVVLAQKQDAAGNQTSLEDTDKKAHGDKTRPVGDHALADSEDS